MPGASPRMRMALQIATGGAYQIKGYANRKGGVQHVDDLDLGGACTI